jgi:hypothetical protein
MVGAVTLSRVVNDPDLAQAILDAAAQPSSRKRQRLREWVDVLIGDVAEPHSLIK